jgi:N4-(beta-N-acetylglucosaminyl)-L-asparaginase
MRILNFIFILVWVSSEIERQVSGLNYPLVLNTWPFVNATAKGWEVLASTDDPLLAVERGCSQCETDRCDGTVGYGGSPDEDAESTLDALVMDGLTHNAGSVAGMKRIKNAISVARAVMNYTRHTLLIAEAATRFAVDMGFVQEDIHSVESMKRWIDWQQNNCQPNFRVNVSPDPSKSCGPYQPLDKASLANRDKLERKGIFSAKSHDTIGMIAINSAGNIAVGTSSNGATHKIPGRVGDAPIIGSGAYVDNDVGAACATGDGDIMMRFLPS